jgi:hypothetical protein
MGEPIALEGDCGMGFFQPSLRDCMVLVNGTQD